MRKNDIIPLYRLKKIRLENGINIIDMSSKLNMSKSMYDYIEKGLRGLSYSRAVEIAQIFKTTPDDIFYKDYKEFFEKNLI